MSARAGNLIKTVLGQIPTVLALAALGGLAWWGHASGWKIPKFAQLAGPAASEQKEDWCSRHNVPDSRCIACRPELVGANPADWCKEHGVAESKCTVCHPEILTKGVAGDWCREHGLPESGCTICHPEIAMKGEAPPPASGITVSSTGAAVRPAAAPSPSPAEHPGAGPAPGPSTDAPTASPREASMCQTHNLRVQFASPQAVAKSGVELAAVSERPFAIAISAYGEVEYDPDRLARVSSRAAGVAWRVDKRPGSAVKKGEVLALIDAGEVGRAKAELVQAAAAVELRTQTLKRLKSSADSGLRTAAELQEAEAALKEADVRLFNARQALVNLGLAAGEADATKLTDPKALTFLGLGEEVTKTLHPRTTTANLLPITAPLDGTVISRDVVAGEAVDSSRPLFTVADTRRMCVILNLPAEEVRRVAVGQPVLFHPDADAADGITGSVEWVSTAVDDQTRTVKVRAGMENADGRLLAHTFGKARITVRRQASAVAVPTQAIQWEGCCHIVFVRLTADIFQTRKVKLGARSGLFTEITAGVLPGEVVVAAGSQVLRSEILKSKLGAGCTDD